MLDHSAHRVYRLHDFTKAHTMEPDSYYPVLGKVNSAGKLYLVIESVKPDAKDNGVLLLMFLLTARGDDPYGLIQTGEEKRDPAWLPV